MENAPEPDQSAGVIEQVAATRRALDEATSLLGQLKIRIDEADALRSTASDAATTIQARLAEAQVAATAAIAARTQVTDEQAVVVTKSAHIQGAQEHADKVRAEIDRLQIATTQSATEAEGQRTRAQAATDAATELLASIRALKATTETDSAATQVARDVAKGAADIAKSLADRSEVIDARVAAYEARLAHLDRQAQDQLKTIVGLLPGATAAGLAHAFDDRRKTFLSPATRWQWFFIGSVACLVLLALSGLYNVHKDTGILGWDDLARVWMARLPIAGALVWLALHASRESALAKRLEEDYGYKATIAASFLGFQTQMAEISQSASEGSALSQLCRDTLATIASPPGRIYDKHRLTITPTGEIAEAASKVIGSETKEKAAVKT